MTNEQSKTPDEACCHVDEASSIPLPSPCSSLSTRATIPITKVSTLREDTGLSSSAPAVTDTAQTDHEGDSNNFECPVSQGQEPLKGPLPPHTSTRATGNSNEITPMHPTAQTLVEGIDDSCCPHPEETKPQIEQEESEAARLERLGRQRPSQFKTLGAEILFAYSILASQMMAEYFVSGFNVILPTLQKQLDIPTASAVWPASAISLTTASFLLPFGRLADMFGGYPVYLAGLAWFVIWSLIAGFASNELFLDMCRAMQGLGPAAFLPSGVMLLGSIYRPGPRKNLMFSLYGSAAPLGFFIGIFFAGVTGSYLPTGWYFWIGAMLTLSTLIPAIWCVPSDMAERKKMGVKMDWWGTGLIVVGLVLIVFAVTDASHAPNGWRTPYIWSLLVVGGLTLMTAAYVEGWVAENPLLPSDLFKIPQLLPLFVALFFSYGVLGIYLLYATLYMEHIMGATPLQVAAWYGPMSIGGIIISVLGGYVLHLLPGTVLILVSGLAWCLASVLFAIAPEGAKYFAYIFPAMICATIGIDITFNVANVFISTSLSHNRQGLAGAVINSLLYLGIAVCLAFGDVTQTETSHLGLKKSYEAVFWYQLACAGTSLMILLCFVRIKRAKSQLTVDEQAALAMNNAEQDVGKENAGQT